MVTVINKKDQKLTINLMGGRSCDLLAKGTANISVNDLTSSHVKTLLAKGDILVIHAGQAKKEKPESSKKNEDDKTDSDKPVLKAVEENKTETHKTDTHRKTVSKKED